MLNAPRTGSSWYGVPGTFVPLGTIVPSTTGPSSFLHCGNSRAFRPHPNVSRNTHRAVSTYNSKYQSRCYCPTGMPATHSQLGINLVVVDVRSNIRNLLVKLSRSRRGCRSAFSRHRGVEWSNKGSWVSKWRSSDEEGPDCSGAADRSSLPEIPGGVSAEIATEHRHDRS